MAERVEEQFTSLGQQHEADRMGMWVFLATEIMLFGGLFMAILVYRVLFPDVVREAASHLNMWLGGVNTAVLLTSSLTMALAVHAARHGRGRRVLQMLAATAGLGSVFLGIKMYEYYREFHEGLMPAAGPPFPIETAGAELYFNVYFAATGLHALHLTLGILTVAILCGALLRGRLVAPDGHMTVELTGMYWHLVDIVWVFLYPVLYLVGR